MKRLHASAMLSWCFWAALSAAAAVPAAEPAGGGAAATTSPAFRMTSAVTRAEVIARTMEPFSIPPGLAGLAGQGGGAVDCSTLTGKVMCGYQGWFACPDDGSGRGWYHWNRAGRFEPGFCNIDLWPDVKELAADERFATAFRRADGRPAEVYSPLVRKTVLRHFQWMKDYGIDGVFVQRFAGEVRVAMGLYHFNTVLANCRAGANLHGRAWAVMYDLSGLPEGGTQVVIDDWKLLVDRMKLGRDAGDRAYLRHAGRPVVAVWGVGFSDDRKYTLAECGRLIDFLRDDAKYGGNTVMVGVPSYWRTLRRDCLADPNVHAVVQKADIVSPWSVGRFGKPEDAAGYAREVWQGDLAWCREHHKDYLPVVFPGFSWSNMRQGKSPLGQIPRQGGKLLWREYVEAKHAGAAMVYQAMFDEMDEGTAVFKCTNDPPAGESKFLTYEGLPSDHYLWLVGQGGRLIRGEIALSDDLPARRGGP